MRMGSKRSAGRAAAPWPAPSRDGASGGPGHAERRSCHHPRVRVAASGWITGLALASACAREPSLAREAVREGDALAEAALREGDALAEAALREGDALADTAVREAAGEAARPPTAVHEPERAAAAGGDERALARIEPAPSGAASSAADRAPTPADAEPRPAFLDFVFVGDVVLGEYVFDGHRSFAGPLAPGDPFADVADLLAADLVVGNLESPVMHEIPAASPLRYGHRFGASAPAVASLAAGGFDVMSLANNHANDLGREGLEQTPEVLRAVGITPVGEARHDGSPLQVVTLEHRGWKIGLLSATTWLNHAPAPGDPKVAVVAVSRLRRTLVPLVEAARAEHDLVIVLLHWGRERRERPEPAQIHAAHALVDAGATLVIGHHPHVLQGIERYGDGLIAYSLGNFLFPAREEGFRDSAVLRVRAAMEPARAVEATASPVRLERAPAHAPRPATSPWQREIRTRLQGLGKQLRTRWCWEAGRLAWPCAQRAKAP